MSLVNFVRVLKEECVQMMKKERIKRREGLKLRAYIEKKSVDRRRLMN
ncbi:hypothetical protein [Hydrogenobacter thermophilus]